MWVVGLSQWNIWGSMGKEMSALETRLGSEDKGLGNLIKGIPPPHFQISTLTFFKDYDILIIFKE